MRYFFFIALLGFTFSSFAQIERNNHSSLSIQQIMQAPEKWIGTSPSEIHWNEASNKIYFSWNPGQDTLPEMYSYNLGLKKTGKVELKEKISLPGKNAQYNANKSQKVFVRNGNIFLLDINTGAEKQLTNWLEQVSSPRFVLNDSEISFRKGDNLYAINTKSGLIRQITNFVSGSEKEEKESKGQARWLENQQKDLFSVLNEREAKSETRKRHNEREEPELPLKIFTGKKMLSQATLSPGGNFVIYSLYERANGKQTSVTHHVTMSGYTEEQRARVKVGSPQGKSEMAIFDVKNNTTTAIDLSQIPGLKDLPDYLKDYPNKMPGNGDEIADREVNLLEPLWNKSEDLAVVVALSEDNKDRWILLLDPSNGNLELLDRQRDEAWIGGPGIGGWGHSTGNIGWMPDGESIWFHSEESGYSHLYAVHIKTKEKKSLTKGEFEVSDAFISKDNSMKGRSIIPFIIAVRTICSLES